ncbi:Nucleoid-associated protein YaaK [hydrothermal vent metagenome]|uniref:Nucleoid-associated protein YaaK n=1 Tax=hydrothermal vent metagenome TaxID=652676 RepID=A0A3B1BRG0_9ZZZZ
MSKGLGNILRQAQQMQKKVKEAQEALEALTFEGESQGKVRATVSGGLILKSLSIDKEIVDPEDIGMLEDIIVLAVNDAVAKAKEAKEKEMGRLAGGSGFNMPDLF